MQRVVDTLSALPSATRFLLLALLGVPLLPDILAYGPWIDHWPVAKSGHPAFDDLSNLWLGAKAAVSGDFSNLFRRDLHEAMLAREFGASVTNQVWSYPPTILLVLLPLGLLPSYAWFVIVWIGAGIGVFTAALLQRPSGAAPVPRVDQMFVWWAALLVPGSMMCLSFGQTGILTSGVLFFGLLLARSKPMVAGAVLALLVAKPHLGVALPVVLAALGAYRTIAWTAISAVIYVALTVVVFGVEPWVQFLTVTVPEHVHYVDNIAAGPDEALKMTMFMFLRTLGASKAIAMGFHVAMSAAVLGAVAVAVRRETDQNVRFLVVALATLLVSPYLLGYELVLAALAIGRVVLDGQTIARLGSVTVLAVCAMISVGHLSAVFGLAPRGVNPTVLIVLGAFVWLTRGHVVETVTSAAAGMAASRGSTPN